MLMLILTLTNRGSGAQAMTTGTAAPAHRHLQQGACAAAEMSSSTAAINAQCCGADDAECAGGLPSSCDAGCAATFLPFWAACGSVMQGAADYSSVVALCEAQLAVEQSSAYQCSCAKGWRGSHCADKDGGGSSQVRHRVMHTCASIHAPPRFVRAR